MASEPVRVLVWAAYPALRAGIAGLLRGAGLAPCEAPSLTALEEGVVEADVLVADVADLEAAAEAAEVAQQAALPLLLVAPGDLDPPGALLDAEGGRGWISRDASGPELAAAVQAVAAGFVVVEPGMLQSRVEELDRERVQPSEVSPLTPRELDVLQWIALGLPNKAIALKLGISEHTVKFHVGSVLSKLDAGSRTEAVTTAARRGLLAL